VVWLRRPFCDNADHRVRLSATGPESHVVGGAIKPASAISSLQSLRAHARAEFLPDACSLADPAIDLVGLAGFRQVTDLHLVNLAAAHSARLVTFDAKIGPTLAPTDQHLVRTLG
jgi:hypothetical protein